MLPSRRRVGGGTTGVIVAVGAENEYANVLSQIGGKYISVSSILDDPNTDPHTFEASPSVAQEISRAELIVQNGVGYDGFMNKIESATPNSKRKVIVAQVVLDKPADTPNPHLWYSPRTMPAVATVIAKDLATLDPTHAVYFQNNLRDVQLVAATVATGDRRLQGEVLRDTGRGHRTCR